MENNITVTLNTDLLTKEIFKSLSLFVEGALRTRKTAFLTYQNIMTQVKVIEGSMRTLQAINSFSDSTFHECSENVYRLLCELREISQVYFERSLQ